MRGVKLAQKDRKKAQMGACRFRGKNKRDPGKGL